MAPTMQFRRASFAALAATSLFAPAGAQGPIELVSVAANGGVSGGWAWETAISADGRCVAFTSSASDIVANDSNGAKDVFVRDRALGVTTCASVGPGGVLANAGSQYVALSADGRHVAFVSTATNLVNGDVNNAGDVFVRDLVAQTTTLASVSHLGGSDDGMDYTPAISADGRFVAFASIATNLVPDDTNGACDVFLRDLATGVNERISRRHNGEQLVKPSRFPALDASGRFVAFSSNGRLLPSDQNDFEDVYVLDRQNATIAHASLNYLGLPGNDQSVYPSLSADGRVVAFWSGANNLLPGWHLYYNPDIYVRDLATGALEIASVNSAGQHSNDFSLYPRISGDGRVVAFESRATNLAPGLSGTLTTPRLYAHDRVSGGTTMLDVAHDGTPPDDDGLTPSLSFDGRYAAFVSRTNELVPGESNDASDVFVRDRAPQVPVSYCTAKPNSAGCTPAIASNGAPSATAMGVFDVFATQIVSSEAGILTYALTPQRRLFQGGRLCVASPITRTAVQLSGGSPPPVDCTGELHFDFNARIQAGLDPALVAGGVVFAQYWYRDGADPSGFGTGLSDALMFTIGP
jgi:Tol biopolymer transport system component